MQAGSGGSQLRIDQNGVPVGLFEGTLGVIPTLQRYSTGAWTNIDSFSSDSGLLQPGLAIDSQNRPVILTHAVESNFEVIHLRAYGASGPTQLISSLPTGSSGAVGLAEVVLASSGDVLVLWTQSDTSSRNRLHVARFRGTAWDTTYGVLSGITNGDTISAAIAVDAGGVPTVAWDERDSASGLDSVFVWKSNY